MLFTIRLPRDRKAVRCRSCGKLLTKARLARGGCGCGCREMAASTSMSLFERAWIKLKKPDLVLVDTGKSPRIGVRRMV